VGARGGTVTISSGNPVHIRLHHVRWVADATVDGTAVWAGNHVTAHLVVRASGLTVRLTATWSPSQHLGVAQVSGTANGAKLLVKLPAP
jgi:hypothetical protein